MLIEHSFEGLSHNFIAATGPVPCDVLLVGESGGCFVADTPVFTEDGASLIQDTLSGSRSYGNGGVVRTDFEYSVRDHPIVGIRANKFPFLRCTPSHLWYTTTRHSYTKTKLPRGLEPPKYVQAAELTPEHYLIIPKPQYVSEDVRVDLWPYKRKRDGYNDTFLPERIEIDSEYAFILGLFIGDGSADYSAGVVRWHLHSITDRVHIDRLERCLRRFGIKISHNICGYVDTVYVSSRTLAAWFRASFYAQDGSKVVPNYVFKFEKRLISDFLYGWFAADGSHDIVSKAGQEITTTSLRAAWQAIRLGLNYGCLFGLQQSNDTRSASWKTLNDITLSNGNIEKLGWVDWHTNGMHCEQHGEDDLNYYVKVRSIETAVYTGTVYDKATERAHYHIPFHVHNSTEDEQGICFVGKTGRELDNFYLPQAMLRRHEVRTTNLLPFHPFSNRNPTKAEIEFFEHYLLAEIEQTKPKLIVPLGAYSMRYFLGGHRDLHQIHGLPFKSKTFPDVTILPSHHPASGLHNSENIPLVTYDFQQIRYFLEGTLPERAIDEFPDPIYIELTTAAEVFQSLEGSNALFMGLDTEGYAGNSWGLSYSIHNGVAYVIRAMSKEALRAFGEWIRLHPEVKIILHNALHDLPILREMGIEITNFEDTMVYAYSLCLEPQGLKDLSYRHCGMKMKSYEDVTGPAMRKKAGEYLVQVARGDWGLDPMVPERESDQEIKYRQPQALHKRALRAVNDIYGFWTGTVIGPKRGGSKRLNELGVRVGKVDKETVACESLPKDMNAWLCEVPIPFKDRLDAVYGDFIFELKEPVLPEDPPDALKRWESMAEDLEESVARCESAIGALPVVGLDAIDEQIAIAYSSRDADATLRMRHKIHAKVESNGLTKLAELDMSVLPYLASMKSAGIYADSEHLTKFGAELAVTMREIQASIEKEIGMWVNPSSSQQTALVVYDILGFPVETRTETGLPSTNDKVLEGLAPHSPVIKLFTDYRELHKLRSTYALKLPKWRDSIGRIHPNWKYTRVPSGRLACSDPNLMAIPVRSRLGGEIRRGFKPRDGCVFVGVDLSQIEMRVLAHLSGDKNLIDVFLSGDDFHTRTAMQAWGLTREEVEADHKLNGGASKRSSGKNVSFGVVYCISAKGLQAQLKSKTGRDWTEEECAEMISNWLDKSYPGVKYYMEKQKFLSRRDGYVSSLFGRRRYVPGVHSSIPRIREESYRQAVNHSVQSGAAEILKLAMVDIWNNAMPLMRSSGVRVDAVLQVHDELIFEIQSDAADEWLGMVKYSMENAFELCVPITAEGHIGKESWADLK